MPWRTTCPMDERTQFISVQVDDVDAVHAAAVKRGLQIAQGLRDQDFGMRHFMVVDPNGLLVNVLDFP
jgi:uncharacterized glyoxalase superfamily protein PhnB